MKRRVETNSPALRFFAGAILGLTALIMLVTGPVLAQALGRVEIGAPAPGFSAKGADGKTHKLSDYRGKVVVLEWTSPVCNYTALKYDNGDIPALQKRAVRDGVVWLSINTASPLKSGYMTAKAAKTRITRLNMRVTAFLFDTDGRLGRAYGAKTTPSFFIITPNGKIAYQGALDDDVYVRGQVTRNYVAAALDDIAAGRPVRDAQTRPYGCLVQY